MGTLDLQPVRGTDDNMDLRLASKMGREQSYGAELFTREI